jgi:hypothetical protein
MTTLPGSEPDAQAEDKPDEEGAIVKNESPWQILIDAVSKYVIIGGFVALVVAILSWTVLGTSLVVKTSVAVWIFALLVVITSAGSLKKAGFRSQITVLAASVGVLCTCSTLIIMQSTKKQPSPPPRTISSEAAVMRETTLRFVDRGTRADPLPAECNQQVVVSGYVPDGYGFAVGNLVSGSTADLAPVYIPNTAGVVTHVGNTWHFPVVFGDSSDAGAEFEAYLVVMPLQELDYLVADGQLTRKEEAQELLTGIAAAKGAIQHAVQDALTESWWTGTGQPPTPAFLRDTQFYQRGNSSVGCPKTL